MTTQPHAVFISTSPSNERMDTPLIRYLSQEGTVAQWVYLHDQEDSPCSLEEALTYLHEYLEGLAPVHLIGHSTGGMVATLYSIRYPEKVKSLTTLAMGINLAMNWIGQYYYNLNFLPYCRTMALSQMARSLFGCSHTDRLKSLIAWLERDLRAAFSLHSPCQIVKIYPQRLLVPMLVCGSEDDVIIDPSTLASWQLWLRSTDHVKIFPKGRHFFHHSYFEAVGKEVLSFWHNLETIESADLCRH